MTGKTHATFAVALIPLAHITTMPQAAGIVVGSLAPDIDAPYSVMGRMFFVGRFMAHRGIMHTPFFGSILSFSMYALFRLVRFSPEVKSAGISFALWFFVGYISHLFLDMCTPMGVPFFYPVKKRRVNIAYIPTNSIWEHLILIGLFVLIAFAERSYFIRYFY